MAVLGSYVYGAEVYGQEVLTTITDIEIVSNDMLKIVYSEDIVVDEAYMSPTNYEVTKLTEGSDVTVRAVMRPVNNKVVNHTLIVIDKASFKTNYTVSVNNIRDRSGDVLSTSIVREFKFNRTKTDSALASLPKHYDKRPESTLRNVLTAMTLSDNKIGGDFS